MRLFALATASALSLPAQGWSDEELVNQSGGFQSDSLTSIMEQVGRLVAVQPQARTPMVARIHGDHREYRLKIDRLLDELCDSNWQVREHAERTLIEIGGRAMTMIQQRRDKYDVLEQHIRCKRIIDRLNAKGTEQEDRERALLQGLVRAALYFDGDERLLRSLRSALGHTDSSVASGALRALGKHGTDNEAHAVANMVTFKNGLYRKTALAALARMQSAKALAHCRELLLGDATEGPLKGVKIDRTEACAIIRSLHARDDAGAKQLLADATNHTDTVIAKAAGISVPEAKAKVAATMTIPQRTQVTGSIAAMRGESFAVTGAFSNMENAELSFSDCNTIDFPSHEVVESAGTRIFLNQGSRLQGEILAIDPDTVKLKSTLFGELTLARKDIQGMAFDPELTRLVGASTDYDRVKMRSGEFLDGKIVSLAGGNATVEVGGATKQVKQADIAGMLFTRPRTTNEDPTSYVRVDLTNGERMIGFVADCSSEHVAVSVPLAGAAVIPWTNVNHVELGVRGGAMWGFTLIADYSDNRIVEVDDQGRIQLVLEDIFGAWDAECLDSGNLLITEFSVSRVQEVNRKGETVWSFEELKNPYDADRLPNGNTLIADTFASRVIEIDKEGNIVWSYDKEIRPFDTDRLANGNTLIADVLKDRVIEVSPEGEIVWEGKSLPNAHDADRLPNGNTLVTLRNQGSVLEIDRDGKIVFELSELSSPSDADRLPNGNTIVAENTRVRVFDRHGNETWRKEMTWAVEVNRY